MASDTSSAKRASRRSVPAGRVAPPSVATITAPQRRSPTFTGAATLPRNERGSSTQGTAPAKARKSSARAASPVRATCTEGRGSVSGTVRSPDGHAFSRADQRPTKVASPSSKRTTAPPATEWTRASSSATRSKMPSGDVSLATATAMRRRASCSKAARRRSPVRHTATRTRRSSTLIGTVTWSSAPWSIAASTPSSLSRATTASTAGPSPGPARSDAISDLPSSSRMSESTATRAMSPSSRTSSARAASSASRTSWPESIRGARTACRTEDSGWATSTRPAAPSRPGGIASMHSDLRPPGGPT